MSRGHLYLIPIAISSNQNAVIPEQVRQVILQTDYFLVEDLRTARRFISSLNLGIKIDALTFEKLDKKSSISQVERIMKPVMEGRNAGIMSESGCPGVADPGSLAVQYAHKKNIEVVPLVGPSSILLALMASGFNGQQFAFHGYLPIDKKQLEQKIKALEEESRRKNQTQLFIEAPYRNNQLLESLTRNGNAETKLCVAKDISGDQQYIKTATLKDWKKTKVDLHKVPTVFALYAGQ